MNTVVILDFGSQYTQLIARRVRELGVYSEILPYNAPLERILALNPKALIFSGGPASVYQKFAPLPDARLYELNLPTLGICYGLQAIARHFGGKVEVAKAREYGRANLVIKRNGTESALFKNVPNSTVWMSHGDKVTALPPGFSVIAESENSELCAVEYLGNGKRIFGLQFHPEVHHTAYGKTILANFLFDVAHLTPDWSPQSFIESEIEKIRLTVGKEHVICALSGGVDSTVAATLVSRAIGKRLKCIFVDNGLLRKNEAQEVRAALRSLGLNLKVVKAADLFLSRLKRIVDPEKKRKIIGKTFIDVFESQITREKFLVQGTLYPDVIESVNVRGPSQTIKTHHNVGGLPKNMKLKLIEPLRELFKDEVRAVGKLLGIPNQILSRHPFPGPGLAVRVIGEVTQARCAILREADAIFIEELRHAELYDKVWQAFAVLLPIQTVGVMGDNRTYENVIALRAVNSTDGMTADWSELPHDFLAKVSNRIINEVRGVNRVVYDISSKPPATIEWE